MKQPTLFEVMPAPAFDVNPCVVLFGYGSEGKKCKTCRLLLKRTGRQGKHWYKCSLRRSCIDPHRMGAASTDQRLSWNACAKYIEEG
jgi:hypothetical protein